MGKRVLKTKFSKIGALLFLVILFSFCNQKSTQHTHLFQEESIQKFDSLFASAINNNQLAGCIAMIAHDDHIEYQKSFGFAEISNQKPLTDNTIIRIASMSKPITVVALMSLYDQGLFELDDPLSKYIPEFGDMEVMVIQRDSAGKVVSYELEPANSPITIRHLLTHTSGITYGFFGRPFISHMYQEAGISDGLTQSPGTIGKMVKKLATMPLYHHPGEAWEYGLNMDVMGYLIEVLSGMPFNMYLEETIFKPIGMRDTYFFVPEFKVDRLAGLYMPDKQSGIVEYPAEQQNFGQIIVSSTYQYMGPKTYFSGGAGLVSTVTDYWRFLRMLLNMGKFDNVRILKKNSVEMITKDLIQVPGFNAAGYNFGLGVAVRNNDTSIEKSPEGTYGWSGIFCTSFWVDPKDKIIGIYMSQLFPNSQVTIRDDFKKLVYNELNKANKISN